MEKAIVRAIKSSYGMYGFKCYRDLKTKWKLIY
jgi:hypothetical protein